MVVCGGSKGGGGVMPYLYYNGVKGISDSIKMAFLCSQVDCIFANTIKIKRFFSKKFGAHP